MVLEVPLLPEDFLSVPDDFSPPDLFVDLLVAVDPDSLLERVRVAFCSDLGLATDVPEPEDVSLLLVPVDVSLLVVPVDVPEEVDLRSVPVETGLLSASVEVDLLVCRGCSGPGSSSRGVLYDGHYLWMLTAWLFPKLSGSFRLWFGKKSFSPRYPLLKFLWTFFADPGESCNTMLYLPCVAPDGNRSSYNSRPVSCHVHRVNKYVCCNRNHASAGNGDRSSACNDHDSRNNYDNDTRNNNPSNKDAMDASMKGNSCSTRVNAIPHRWGER